MPTQAQLNALPYTLDNPVSGLQNIDAINPVWAANGFDNTLVTAWTPRGNSMYNGMALQMTRRFSKGLATIVSYTWSHNIDDSSATHYSTVLSPRRVQDFSDRAAEKASSALDRRQRLSVI